MRAVLSIIVVIFLLSSSAWCQENIVKLTLKESIEQALKDNLDLKIAEVQFQGTESEVAEKEASFKLKTNLEVAPLTWKGEIDNFNYRPEANISANLLTKSGTTYSLNIEEEKGEDERLKTTLLSLTLTQGILPSPKLTPSYLSLKKSLLDLRKNKFSLREEENDLKLEVKTSFYTILKQKREIEIEKLHLEQTKESLIILEDKLRKGLANELDLLNAQLEVISAKKALFQDQNQLTRYLIEFKSLLGIDSRIDVELVEESKYEYEPLKLKLNQAIEEALKNRVEIKQQKLTVEICQLDLALTKSKLSPSLNFSGGYSYSYGSKLQDEEKEEYRASLILEIPLLDGGESKAEIQGAEEKLKESQLNLKKLKRDISTEVQNYFLNLWEKEKQIEFFNLSKERYQKDLSIAQERLSSGSITKDELREKEINFKQEQIELLDALLDCELTKLELLKSIGKEL